MFLYIQNEGEIICLLTVAHSFCCWLFHFWFSDNHVVHYCQSLLLEEPLLYVFLSHMQKLGSKLFFLKNHYQRILFLKTYHDKYNTTIIPQVHIVFNPKKLSYNRLNGICCPSTAEWWMASGSALANDPKYNHIKAISVSGG